MALVLSGCGTDTGTGSDDSGDCDFGLTIDNAVCRFWDNPDYFDSDFWFVDLSGTARGPASTEITVNYSAAYNTEMRCSNWSGNGTTAFSCISQSGQPNTTTWNATVSILAGSGEVSRSVGLNARVRGVYSSSCHNNKIVDRTIACHR